jgi:crossover junction endodeoxyribonuclease RuvC
MLIAGIDPGLSGAIALRDTDDGSMRVVDIPTFSLSRNGKNKREIDAVTLSIMLDLSIGHAFVEQVGAMPHQGVSGVFAFGKSYGIIIGVLAARGVPMTFVNPRVWKKSLGVPAAKDGARARASQLMPSSAEWWTRVKDDGRAEAALIAYWGIRSLAGIGKTMPAKLAPPHKLGPLFAERS